MKTLQNLKSEQWERDDMKRLQHTPSTKLCGRGDEKGVLKFFSFSLRYFVIIFHLLHKAIVGCWGDESRILCTRILAVATTMSGENKR